MINWPARGGGGAGSKIPGARSAQRGPEISVKYSYCLSSLYFSRFMFIYLHTIR